MDIDIDVPSTFDPIEIFSNWTRAIQIINGVSKKHPCGIYAQKIPRDPITNNAAIPFKDAERLGYIKIDFLHNTVYNKFSSREEIELLLNEDPPWDLLKSKSVVDQLFQLSKHYDIIKKINPKSVEELADTIALIRPGKIELLDQYLKDRNLMRPLLYHYDEDNEGFSFKKSHSIAYALVIVLQLHLINIGVSFEN